MPDEDWEEDTPTTIHPVSDASFAHWVSDLVAIEGVDELQGFAKRRFAVAPELHQLLHLRALMIRAYEAACAPSLERWDRIRLGHLALDSQGDKVVEETLQGAASTPPAVVQDDVWMQAPSAPSPSPQPFRPPATPSGLRRPQEQASPPQHLSAPVPSPTTDDIDIDATAALDASMLEDALRGDGANLPFSGKAEAPPPIVDEAPHVAAGATEGIDVDVVASIIATSDVVTAFREASVTLTIDQYAALVARGERSSGHDQAALLREYGLQDEAHRKQVDTHFSELFARNETARTRFADSLRRWKGWLESQGTA